MVRKKIIAGNWKMNLAWGEVSRLSDRLLPQLPAQAEVILAAPFIYLQSLLEKTRVIAGLRIAAQDCSVHTSGAYTGEVSATQLASIGVSHCIVGHSERRQYHQETDAMVAAKTDRLLEHDLHPIFCCGERKEHRESGKHMETVLSQLENGFFHLDAASASKCILAYEPVWAIGTGLTATPAQAQEMHGRIREWLSKKYSPAMAAKLPILYGGSVTAANARELFSCPDVDGGLVGGASLKASEFIDIIQSVSSKSPA